MNGPADGFYQKLEWTDEHVSRFWRWQAQYPKTYFTYQFGSRIAARLKNRLAGCEAVVDYGCGPGFLIPHLVSLGKHVTAADFSLAAVDTANERFGHLAGFDGAMTVDRLVEDARTFDAAVSVEVIEHLNDRHLTGFFDNLRRLLRPGGTAVITTPNDENLEASMVYCPASDVVFHRWQHVRSWNPVSLASAAEENGLAVVETFTTDFSRPVPDDPVRLLKRMAKWMLGRPDKRPHLVCVTRRAA